MQDRKHALRLKQWRRAAKLTRARAAGQIGISERMLTYYERGEYAVPRTVLLAVEALQAPRGWHPECRERWVTAVRNLLDYGNGEPVAGRLLKQRNKAEFDDFIALAKFGPEPATALTDPALFKALRDAGTKAYAAGLTALF